MKRLSPFTVNIILCYNANPFLHLFDFTLQCCILFYEDSNIIFSYANCLEKKQFEEHFLFEDLKCC